MMLAPLLLSIYKISFATAAIGPLIDPLSDSQFSSNSNIIDNVCEPWDAKYTVSDNRDGWCGGNSGFGAPDGTYLEINFGRKTNIHAIATKGRGCCTQYVTSYILSYYDVNTWIEYDSGFVFVGNNNNNGNYQEEVRHELIDYNGLIVAAQYIRFYPITCANHASMRVEAYGNDWTASPTESPSKPPSLNPTVSYTIDPTISPTKYPTKSPTTAYPSTHPTLNPSYSPSKTPSKSPSKTPTFEPTFYPSLIPSKSPTKHPSLIPTLTPTQNTNNPTRTPLPPGVTHYPSVSPTKTPTIITIYPSNSPTNVPTISPTNIPSITPTYYPTNNPTRINNGGEVINEFETSEQIVDNGNGNGNGVAANGESTLPIWIYILLGCSVILCCLGCLLIGWKIKHSNKRKESDGDAFRMEANTQMDGMGMATQMDGMGDLWSNPVHHQVASISGKGTGEGNIMTTLSKDDSISSSNEEDNYDHMYTVPIKNKGMNNELDDDDRTPTTIEMNDVNRTREGPTPNGYENEDDDIDNINNAYGAQNDDNEFINDIDNIMTPNGDNIDLLTAGGDDDIDAINNNINIVNDEIINEIDDMITKGENYIQEGDTDDDDVISDDLQHEMQTPGGDDDDDSIDDIDMDEDDDDFPQTIQ